MTKQPKYLIVISLLFSIMSFGQNDWNVLKLHANPKSIKHINYNIIEHFGDIKVLDVINGVNYTFNDKGFLVTKENYGKNTKTLDKHSFTYGPFNTILEQNITDKDGKLIRRITYEYNELHKPTFQNIYKSDGSLISKSAYSYVKRYKLDNVITYDSGGEKKNLQKFSYQKRKQTRLVTTSNLKSKLKSVTKKYDKYDNLLESSVFDVMEDLKTNIVFKYNEDNKLIESRYFEKEKLITKRDLTYNNLGFLVKETIEYPQIDQTDIITYTYSIDKKSNWYKRIKYVNSVPIKMEERTIIYF